MLLMDVQGWIQSDLGRFVLRPIGAMPVVGAARALRE